MSVLNKLLSTTSLNDKKTIGKRRLSRELTLRLLFFLDTIETTPENVVHLFEKSFSPEFDSEKALEIENKDFKKSWPLATEFFLAICGEKTFLDADIQMAVENWSLTRLTPIDKSILRLAYYEMVFRNDIPLKVSVNEAVELAKTYGDGDSRSFINGVLDKLMKKIKDENEIKKD